MNYGKLKPKEYKERITDRKLSKYLEDFGAVEVSGTMWCGKTWTSLAFGESVTRIGTEAGRKTAEADPSLTLLGETPHVIDEWQDVPAIWDEVRAYVDEHNSDPGQFILTGSSNANKKNVQHSGAGRIKKIRMRTMSLSESKESSSAISLSGLFNGEFKPVSVQQKLLPIAKILCRGGWPAVIFGKKKASSSIIDGYLDALFDINIPKKNLNSVEARKVSLGLARNLGQSVTLATIAEDAGFREADSKSATAKVSQYLSALEELYVIEAVKGWDAPIRSKSRLRTKPKYYFADPSLAVSLLQITPERLIDDGQLFGLLFEHLCMHDLAVYSEALPDAGEHSLYYYRDSDGLEIDAVIELRDGRWAGFEIKLGENRFEEAAKALNRLRNKIAANPQARNKDPEFMAVIVGAGEMARYDKNYDVYVVPITSLGV